MKKYKNIIDVRAPWEYADGHVPGSVNIPLDQVQEKKDEIQNMEQPILLCCASGNRSGVATQFLQDQGVNCENGGGWKSVEFAIENQQVCLEK